MYRVKEIFYSLQGEGRHTGRASVFCRFTGCNLWSGKEEDREKAICKFCDTDFYGTDGPGGGVFDSAAALADSIHSAWPRREASAKVVPYVVFTGGEPLLQLDEELIRAVHDRGFEIAVETNGTIAVPPGVDWVCVSPKAGTALSVVTGDELKLIFPQAGAAPESYEGLPFDHFYLQPMDGPDRARNESLATQYCLRNPQWRISLQTHKYLGIL